MRYLNIYEEFGSNEDVKSDIKDIFVELEDKGFTVLIDDSSHHSGFITILLPNDKLFTLESEIIESILRLIDYLKINGLYLNELNIISRYGSKRDPYDITRTVHLPNQSSLRNPPDITEEGIFIKGLYGSGDTELKVDNVRNLFYIKIKYSKENKWDT